MNRFATGVAFALALATAPKASAQELNYAKASTEEPNIVMFRTGVDHAFLAEVGYRRALALGKPWVFLGGDAATPWAKPDLDDYRLRATIGLAFGTEHFKVAGWIAPTLRGTENAASRMTAVGSDVRATIGFYSAHWFGAGEAGFDWLAATHISFRQAYRTTVYEGAHDGWYGLAGGTTYAGLQTGVSFSRLDLILRAGHPGTSTLDDQTLDFYATAGVNVRLP